MQLVDELARIVAGKAESARRLIVAIAGPPASGKSTLAEDLCNTLDGLGNGKSSATLIPMDGFHFDNAVLEKRGIRHRKGAPQTFDADGYVALMRRTADNTGDVAVPIFDRHLDLARAGAAVVSREHRFIITEGNYLLLDEAPWSGLSPLFDVTIWLDVDDDVIEERLVRRWLYHGHQRDAATRRALDNDMPNARYVKENSRPADIVWPG